MNGTWALVPLKRLDRAKRRLAPALSGPERGRLVLAMVKDVLAVLDAVERIEWTLLVSNEPEAGCLLPRGNFEVFYSAQSEGMNRELEHAAAYASARGAKQALIVHADLPFLTPAAMRRFLDAARGRDLLAAACKHGTGTNLLLTPLPLVIPLVFGAGSMSRFRRLAEAAGQELGVITEPCLSADIDDPEDYAQLLNHERCELASGPATREFLAERVPC